MKEHSTMTSLMVMVYELLTAVGMAITGTSASIPMGCVMDMGALDLTMGTYCSSYSLLQNRLILL